MLGMHLLHHSQKKTRVKRMHTHGCHHRCHCLACVLLCTADTHQHHHHVHHCGQEIVLALAVTRTRTITWIIVRCLCTHHDANPFSNASNCVATDHHGGTCHCSILHDIAHGCVTSTSWIGLLLCQCLLFHLVSKQQNIADSKLPWWLETWTNQTMSIPSMDCMEPISSNGMFLTKAYGFVACWIVTPQMDILCLYCHGWIIPWSVQLMYQIQPKLMFLHMLEEDNDE